MFFSQPAVNSFWNFFKLRHIFEILLNVNFATFVTLIKSFIWTDYFFIRFFLINLSVSTFCELLLFIFYRCFRIVSFGISLQECLRFGFRFFFFYRRAFNFLDFLFFYVEFCENGAAFDFNERRFFFWLWDNLDRALFKNRVEAFCGRINLINRFSL